MVRVTSSSSSYQSSHRVTGSSSHGLISGSGIRYPVSGSLLGSGLGGHHIVSSSGSHVIGGGSHIIGGGSHIIGGGSHIIGGSHIVQGGVTGHSTSKKTVTVSKGYGPSVSTTTVTTSRPQGMLSSWHQRPTTTVLATPTWVTTPSISLGSSGLVGSHISGSHVIGGGSHIIGGGSHMGSTTISTGASSVTTSVQRYEWRMGADGVMRKVLVEDTTTNNGVPMPSLNGGFCGYSIPNSNGPSPSNTQSSEAPERQVSSNSSDSVASRGGDTTTKMADKAEKAEVTRIARMRAAAEKIMLMNKTKNAQEDERKRQEELAAEIQRLKNSKSDSLEDKLQTMMQEMERMKQQQADGEAMRRKIEEDMLEKRRQEEADRRAALEAELQQLRQIEAEKTRLLEEQIQQLKDSAQAQQLRMVQESELMDLQQQREMLNKTIKIEEAAAVQSVSQGDLYVAVDHPFKSLMIQLHSLQQLGQIDASLKQLWCHMRLGRSHLKVDANRMAAGFEWDDLLTFPYMNERYLKISLETARSGGQSVGGVKIDLEDFLLNPQEMCCRHEIPVVNTSNAHVGLLNVTVQLGGDFVNRAYSSIRSQPLLAPGAAMMQQTRPVTAMSSILTGYQSVNLHLHSMKDMKMPIPPMSQVVFKATLGAQSLSSPPVSVQSDAANWDIGFCLPFNADKYLSLLVFLDQAQHEVLASASIDLDTLLMAGSPAHALNVCLKRGTEAVGAVAMALEFHEVVTAPSVGKTSSWSSQSLSQSVGPAMTSMLAMMNGQTLTGQTALEFPGFQGSMLTDTGLGWGLLPMLPLTVNGNLMGQAEQIASIIPRPTNCKVQIHHIRDLVDSFNGAVNPTIKVMVDGRSAQTESATPTSLNSAKWKGSHGCMHFKISIDADVEKINEAMKTMVVEAWNGDSHIGSSEVSLLPIITVATGYFCGDVQLVREINGVVQRCGVVNVTVQTF